MAEAMARKRPRPRLALPSLLGDGMPERLRSTSIALVGAVVAVGLGTIAFTLQLGLPSVVRGPLPQPPPKRHAFERHRVEPRAADATVSAGGGRDAGPPATDRRSAPRDSSPSAPAGEQLGEGTVLVTDAPPARSQPKRTSPPRRASAPGPIPSEPPPAPAPAEPTASASEVPPPAPEAAAGPPASTHPGNGHAYGKGNGNGLGTGGEPPGQVAKAAREGEGSE
jgi:hypothetical protein